LNYIDLFSGIGGFALGAYWAGWRFDEHYFSEVDDYAIRVYQKRFPEAVNLGDITKIVANAKNTDWWRTGREKITGGRDKETRRCINDSWILTGGFPCQDISCAGKGEGISGSRSGLWFAMRDVIRLLRPRYCIIENVGAIVNRGLDVVLGNLAEIGYDAEWQDIRASDVGAPHRRERIWIVAYPNNATTARQREDSGKIHTKSKSERFNICSGARLRKREQGNGRFCNWSVEPDVGRVAHGIPSKMDGGIDEILRVLWEKDGTAEMVKRRIGQSMAQSSILFKQMLRRLDYLTESGETNKWKKESAKTLENESMRYVWVKDWFAKASQGQESFKQSNGELSYSLSSLPQERSQKGWDMGNPWIQEPDIPRVASGIKDRVSRLKGLGNSIVPQIAELLFRRIKEIEQENT